MPQASDMLLKNPAGNEDRAGNEILILCQRLPYPPNKGDRIRTFHIIDHLVGQGWRIHLATLLDKPEEAVHMDALRPYCASLYAVHLPRWRRLPFLWRGALGSSLSVEYFRSRRLQKHVDTLLATRTIAATLAISAPMAEYLRRTPGPLPRRMVLDLVDVDSEKWRAYAAKGGFPLGCVHALESRLLARYEEKAGTHFGSVILVSAPEAALLRPRAVGRFSVESVPNGVDADYFAPALHEYEPARNTMIFCGAMDYPPNIDAVEWFARDVLPRIRQRLPDVRFCIAGSNPAARVRALDALPGIQVTGTVPDIRPLVQAATVSVAPMRLARGVQNKVLEAMAMGKAVLATPQALEGLDVVPGEAAAMAPDEPQAFAQAALGLLLDGARRRDMGRRARALVVERHAWDTCLKPLERLLA